MISVNKALDLISSNSSKIDTRIISLEESLGFTLASNIKSKINMPSFRQSAMDGYAINYDTSLMKYLQIDEIPAGKNPENISLEKGECVRIFTGSAVPKGATSVIQQEWCEVKNNQLFFLKNIEDGLNIRPIGEQIKIGDSLLSKGHLISPSSIGLLSGIGIEKITVFRKPKVGIVITGNELVLPGISLKKGEVYESNSYMLSAALQKFGYLNRKIYRAKDDFKNTVSIISKALSENDVVLVSGGISVGDYDFVLKASLSLGIKELFYKVNQKPGKPLFFGKKNKKALFGLPGNPGAALTCFYIYVLRYLSLISSSTYPLKQTQVVLNQTYKKKTTRAEFLKAIITDQTADICNFQNSSMLRSFAKANSLLYIGDEKLEVKKGEEISAYLLL